MELHAWARCRGWCWPASAGSSGGASGHTSTAQGASAASVASVISLLQPGSFHLSSLLSDLLHIKWELEVACWFTVCTGAKHLPGWFLRSLQLMEGELDTGLPCTICKGRFSRGEIKAGENLYCFRSHFKVFLINLFLAKMLLITFIFFILS